MKLTHVLFKTNLHRMYVTKWRLKRHRKIVDGGIASELSNRGLFVENAEDVARPERTFEKIDLIQSVHQVASRDNTHPNWHDKACHLFNEDTALIEGMDQAQALTKTLQFNNNLPKEIEDRTRSHDTSILEDVVKRNILNSCVYDAAQEKLPKVVLPEKPHFNMPRVYGIPLTRKNNLLSQSLLCCCNLFPAKTMRFLKREGKVEAALEKDGGLLKLSVTGNHMIFTSKPLALVADIEDFPKVSLPDIYPLNSTVALKRENIYSLADIFPVSAESPCRHAHMVIFHHNIHDSGWTDTQFCGSTLVKGFAVAVAQARQRFGCNVKNLPAPVSLIVVHTDGKHFHFGVFQLNTLDISGTVGTKNLFWSLPPMPLFSSCTYRKGKPTLEGYNPEVFQLLFTLYHTDL